MAVCRSAQHCSISNRRINASCDCQSGQVKDAWEQSRPVTELMKHLVALAREQYPAEAKANGNEQHGAEDDVHHDQQHHPAASLAGH